MFNDDQTFCVDEFRVERVMKMKKNTTKSFDCGPSDVSFFIEKNKKNTKEDRNRFLIKVEALSNAITSMDSKMIAPDFSSQLVSTGFPSKNTSSFRNNSTEYANLQ